MGTYFYKFNLLCRGLLSVPLMPFWSVWFLTDEYLKLEKDLLQVQKGIIKWDQRETFGSDLLMLLDFFSHRKCLLTPNNHFLVTLVDPSWSFRYFYFIKTSTLNSNRLSSFSSGFGNTRTLLRSWWKNNPSKIIFGSSLCTALWRKKQTKA